MSLLHVSKQVLHAAVLDIKVCYYLRTVIFHKAAGWLEYWHSKCSNKPDTQHSTNAIFVLLYSLHLCTKLCRGFEDRDDAPFYDHAKSPTAKKSHHDSPNLVCACMLAFQNDDSAWEWKIGKSWRRQTATSLQANIRYWFLSFPLEQWHTDQYLDGTQTMMPLSEYLRSNLGSFNSMPTTKQHIARQTLPFAPPLF